ncbi:MAG: hypothetical protein WCW52_10205 [Elusimicrobiales bacterium]
MLEEQKNGWAVWVLLPVCILATVLVTRWLIKHHTGAPSALTEEYTAEEAKMPDDRDADQDEAAESGPGEAGAPSIPGAVMPGSEPVPAKPAPAAPAVAVQDKRSAKKQWSLGRTRDALSKFAAGSLNNPKALAAILNNQYVVDGFMSRPTVKGLTGNPKALANYLKNPANLSKFMNKTAVKGGLNDARLVDAVGSSKLVGAMLDTPGGRGLLTDPQALTDVLMANPALASALLNPNVLNALMNNPKTVGLVNVLSMSGGSR